MSINSLTNAAAARRADTIPLQSVPQGLAQIAAAHYTTPTVETVPAAPAAAAPRPAAGQMDTAFNVIFGYIPTEIVTLYVAVLAGINTDDAVLPGDWRTFWCFLASTPLVIWVVFATKLKAIGKPLPAHPGSWPLWEMSAGTLAFGAWAFAMPSTPFAAYAENGWYSPGLAGVVVLVVSASLGLVAPLFQRPLRA
jgi:hypothetical protein